MIWALGSRFNDGGKWLVLEGAEAGWWECALTPALPTFESSVSSLSFPAAVGMIVCQLAWCPTSDVDRHRATKYLAIVVRVDPSFSGLALVELEVRIMDLEHAARTCTKLSFQYTKLRQIHLRYFYAFLVTYVPVCLDPSSEEEELENPEMKLISEECEHMGGWQGSH